MVSKLEKNLAEQQRATQEQQQARQAAEDKLRAAEAEQRRAASGKSNYEHEAVIAKLEREHAAATAKMQQELQSRHARLVSNDAKLASLRVALGRAKKEATRLAARQHCRNLKRQRETTAAMGAVDDEFRPATPSDQRSLTLPSEFTHRAALNMARTVGGWLLEAGERAEDGKGGELQLFVVDTLKKRLQQPALPAGTACFPKQ